MHWQNNNTHGPSVQTNYKFLFYRHKQMDLFMSLAPMAGTVTNIVKYLAANKLPQNLVEAKNRSQRVNTELTSAKWSEALEIKDSVALFLLEF